ncbi:MAG: malate/lactate/ureidoglycolate dehydrogenase [Granulosicoccus sp.]|nr:malate/lactate/ureidoglycolate dehydrogenase [Granulosicoccus sp.]
MPAELPVVDGQVLLPAKGITELIKTIFVRAGGSESEANDISLHLVEATASGHDSHGIIRVPRYLEALANGHVSFGKLPVPVMESDNFVLFEGSHGFGQTLGKKATEYGIKKAQAHGVALVGLRNSGHIGRIGAWAEQACAANIVSVHFVNVSGALLVAPFGGAGRRMSTNPIAVGVPNAGGDDFVLDFATSRVAEGKVLVAQKAGKQVDAACLVDGEGQATGDPLALYGQVAKGQVPDPREGAGALTPMGEHKGSGLSLACELLAGALTGSGTSGPGGRVHNGMLSVFVDPTVMDDGHAWAKSVSEYIDYVRSCPAAKSVDAVLIPGDPERQARKHRIQQGIPLDEQSFADIISAAEKLGLSEDASLAILQ